MKSHTASSGCRSLHETRRLADWREPVSTALTRINGVELPSGTTTKSEFDCEFNRFAEVLLFASDGSSTLLIRVKAVDLVLE
jgi:hypothetical protein